MINKKYSVSLVRDLKKKFPKQCFSDSDYIVPVHHIFKNFRHIVNSLKYPDSDGYFVSYVDKRVNKTICRAAMQIILSVAAPNNYRIQSLKISKSYDKRKKKYFKKAIFKFSATKRDKEKVVVEEISFLKLIYEKIIRDKIYKMFEKKK